MLRDVCVAIGVTRRAVQGYERAGLVAASGKTSRGYLLYDEMAQERIRKIKLFQDLGFSIKEIAALIDAPNHVLKAALQIRIAELEKEGQRLKRMVEVAVKMMEGL